MKKPMVPVLDAEVVARKLAAMSLGRAAARLEQAVAQAQLVVGSR
jgi:hypothetical protein